MLKFFKYTYGIILIIGLCLLLQMPAYAEGTQYKASSSKSVKKQVSKSVLVKNKKVLQKRLRISKARANAIIVGERGKANVQRFIANDFGETKYECSPNGCTCHGDNDCNLMFTQACANTSSNGSCTGDVCTCTP